MKRLTFLLILLFYATSCNQNRLNESLASYIQNTLDNDILYKLVEANIVRELDASNMISEIDTFLTVKSGMKFLKNEPDIEEFKKIRNRGFKKFRPFSPEYEHDITKGELRDTYG